MEKTKGYTNLKEFEKAHGETFLHIMKLFDSKIQKRGANDERLD
ncbi:MAG TPA: hypothetical protein VJG83_02580 [archaeon]|nr:hypothetical protein [archaeon]